MERGELALLTERLRTEILAPKTAALAPMLEDLRGKPPKAFHEAVTPLIQEAGRELHHLLEVPMHKGFPSEIVQTFYGYTAFDFNSVLPADYPYIVGIVNILSERKYQLTLLVRRCVSEPFPGLPPAAIPIVSVETSEDLEGGNFTSMEVAFHPEDIRIVPFPKSAQ